MKISIPTLDPNALTNQLHKSMGLGADPVVRNQWFNNQDITLDGWHFVSCRFDNCRLHIGSAKFKLERCFVDDKSHIVINNEASNIVRMFHLRNRYMVENFPFYAPKYNEDGTFTVEGC